MENEQNTVIINNTELLVKDYSEQRVVTFKDIDQVHGRPSGTARKRFNDNKKHFIEGEDFYTLDQPSEIRTLGLERPQGGVPEKVMLITETGYLMLVKSFTDDLAWKVQRELVNTYFRAKEKPDSESQEKILKILNLIGEWTPEKLPYIGTVLSALGYATISSKGQKPSEASTNSKFRTKNGHTSETAVPGFDADILCAYAGQLRNMGEDRNGWVILPNNEFKDFCASHAISANTFCKWLYENGYILGHTENKSGSTKYTFVYRFNGENARVIKFSDGQCVAAERRLL